MAARKDGLRLLREPRKMANDIELVNTRHSIGHVNSKIDVRACVRETINCFVAHLLLAIAIST